jgi:hypothetical protein
MCLCTTEEKIAILEDQLATQKQSLMNAIDEAQELTDRIYANLDRRIGLTIRCLTKPLLSHVLSFLGGQSSSVSIVCKYWLLCCRDLERAKHPQLTPRGAADDGKPKTGNEVLLKV